MTSFCLSCLVPVCPLCLAEGGHTAHDQATLADGATRMRSRVADMCLDMRQQAEKLDGVARRLQVERETLDGKRVRAVHAANAAYAEVCVVCVWCVSVCVCMRACCCGRVGEWVGAGGCVSLGHAPLTD